MPQQSDLSDYFKSFAGWLGIVVAFTGFTVFLGWILNIAVLRTLSSTTIILETNIALGLICAGSALSILSTEGPRSSLRRLGLALALAVTVIGLIAIEQNAITWLISAENLSSYRFMDALGNSASGHVSFAIAAEFLLIGASLFALGTKDRTLSKLGRTFTLLSLPLPAVAILGYLYGVEQFYIISNYAEMPLLTALTLLILSFGLFLSRPDRGFVSVLASGDLDGMVARRLFPAVIFIPLLAILAIKFGEGKQLFESGFALALAALSLIALLSIVVVWASNRLKSINDLRKLAERQLRLTEERHHLFVESTHDAFIATDSQGNITDWNRQASETFGWAQEDVLGKPLAEIIIPVPLRDAHNTVFEHYGRTATGPILNQTIEIMALHNDGHEFPIEFAITPVKTEGALTFCAFIRDITKRKRTAQELAQARDQALEASRFKSEFLANMSHEIRTPMNAVIGMSDLLCSTPLNEEQRDFATTIHSSAESLLGIINDILDYSKIEAGKLDLEIIDFDPVALVEGTAELLAAKAREKHLTLMTYVSPDLPGLLRGDAARIRQVLLNLLSNSIKFTEHGEVTVEAALEAEEDSKLRVRFSVRDSGIGMTEAAQKRLFMPFTQADKSVFRKYGGTGLGLSISKHLVEMMNGKLDLMSTSGAGTTFWFSVPLEGSTHSLFAGHHDDLEGIKMLMVDGQTGTRQILLSYAKSWGIACEYASTIHEALATMWKQAKAGSPFDIVFVDMGVGQPNAFEFAQTIRYDELLVRTKLILIDSSLDSMSGQQALRVGYSAYLLKPLKQSQLFDCIVNVLKSSTDEEQSQIKKTISKIMKAAQPPSPASLILVAEDNTVNQKVALLLLRELGYAAHAVANGHEAVEAIGRTNYALILMDCQMPEMDGLEATAAIRKMEALTGKHTPIIALTAHAMAEDREQCIAAGMDDYVSKPVTANKLGEVLERWLHEEKPYTVIEPQANPPQQRKSYRTEPVPRSPLALDTFLQTYGKEAGHELIREFLTECERLLAELEPQIDAHDQPSVKATIHQTKGICSSVYASDMARLSRSLETAVQAEDWTKVSLTHKKLLGAYAKVRAYLEENAIAFRS